MWSKQGSYLSIYEILQLSSIDSVRVNYADLWFSLLMIKTPTFPTVSWKDCANALHNKHIILSK